MSVPCPFDVRPALTALLSFTDVPTQECTARSVDVLERARSRMPGMSPAIQRVAQTVLGNPERALGFSAARLADVSGSSVGSVVRFCQELGYPGYQDFKLGLAARPIVERAPQHAVLGLEDEPTEVARKVLGSIVSGLSSAGRSLDLDKLVEVAKLLGDARRILVVGIGTSTPLASDFASRLFGAGVLASYPADTRGQLDAATRLGPGDVCFAISNSGTTEHTIAAVRESRANGAATAALTSYATAPLASTADHVIIVGCPADLYRSADMASRIAHHTVIQVLWALIRHQQE